MTTGFSFTETRYIKTASRFQYIKKEINVSNTMFISTLEIKPCSKKLSHLPTRHFVGYHSELTDVAILTGPYYISSPPSAL